MAPSARFCIRCGAALPVNSIFCPSCGAAQPLVPGLGGVSPGPPIPTPPPAAGRSPLDVLASPGPPMPYSIPSFIARDRDRTVTGLLLLVIGFALSWIPYVDVIGGLLALIGIILVFLGRAGFGPIHHRDVVIGGVLYLLTLLGVLILAVSFVAAIISAAPAPGAPLSSLGATLTSDLMYFLVGAAVLGILGALGQVIMVYGLADRTTRGLLWLGFVAGTVLPIVSLLILWPDIATAVSQATSGTSLNLAPLNQIEATENLLSLTKVVPSVLFAWAYYRCRSWAIAIGNTPLR